MKKGEVYEKQKGMCWCLLGIIRSVYFNGTADKRRKSGEFNKTSHSLVGNGDNLAGFGSSSLDKEKHREE